MQSVYDSALIGLAHVLVHTHGRGRPGDAGQESEGNAGHTHHDSAELGATEVEKSSSGHEGPEAEGGEENAAVHSDAPVVHGGSGNCWLDDGQAAFAMDAAPFRAAVWVVGVHREHRAAFKAVHRLDVWVDADNAGRWGGEHHAACIRRTSHATPGCRRSHFTPVSRSMAGQDAAGTLPRWRHMLGALGETPILLASAPTPPAASIASSSATMFSGFFIDAPITHVRDCAPHTLVMQASSQITFVANRPKNLLTIGERIAWARNERGMSQKALALAAGVSQGTIGNVESGLRDKPRDLLAIAEALNASPQWLERGEGEWNVFTSNYDDAFTEAVRQARTVDESEWSLLEDFKMLPDDEKAALRATLKAKADHVRKIVNEYLGKRGISSTPVPDSRVEAAFGPSPPPTGAGSWKKITPVPEAPRPAKAKGK